VSMASPLVKQLTAQVKARDPDAARYVHWGATSQDAIDTGPASPRAVKSIASWRQAATIGPTAAVGTMPQAACAWASAASKSSIGQGIALIIERV
jgi:hypothetical protein